MKHVVLRFLPIWALVTAVLADPLPVVAIQPLGPVKQADIQHVKAGIEALYAVTVEVLPEKPLPKVAYYPPRGRYKADDLIDVLANEMPERITKILGFTTRDISTTNDDGNDWGIFGLG
ncbi:MAG: hypothetical protein V4689_15175 [Verrucomicrobiota bacterium]